MSQLSDLYEQAVRSGNTNQATYYAQALAAQAHIPIQGVTGASASQLPGLPALNPSNTPLVPGNPIQDFFDWLNKNDPTVGTIFDPMKGPNPITMGQNAGKDTAAALSFLTDIPRVVTTVLGIILIIAGIFALSRGPAVEIIGGHIAGALTS